MEQEKKKVTRRHDARIQAFFKDIDGFTQVQKNMIVQWWPWAMTYYNNLLRKYPHVPDDVLYDGAVEALIYSVREWDPNGGSKFKSWFHKACLFDVNRSIRRWHRGYMVDYHRDAPVYRHTDPEDYGKLLYADTRVCGFTEWEDEATDRIILADIMSCLNETQKTIVRRIAIYNEKQADIARDMGCTRQYVNNEYRKAMAKLREAAKEVIE